jgi:hypothetical protein
MGSSPIQLFSANCDCDFPPIRALSVVRLACLLSLWLAALVFSYFLIEPERKLKVIWYPKWDFDPNLPVKVIFHRISEASPLGLEPKLVQVHAHVVLIIQEEESDCSVLRAQMCTFVRCFFPVLMFVKYRWNEIFGFTQSYSLNMRICLSWSFFDA